MIVFSKLEAEHMEHLRAVFEMLRKERLVVNRKKSEFFMEEIHFLGRVVLKDGIRMDFAKIKAIQNWPEPVNLHEDKLEIMSLESLKMERDAAIRAREDDLATQLRVMRKRLQEAEEEQYKAEEDSTSLRAELELLQRREEDRRLVASSATSDQHYLRQQEIEALKIELQVQEVMFLWPEVTFCL
ncbi:hypothetical protein L7F22_049143 [Adiantum nelumboides]|nr:hypothetical protein [Adiantum nelumboides]